MAEEIVVEILWLPSAKSSFNNIIEYLQEEWTDKEVEKFIARTEDMLLLLKRYPEMSGLPQKEKT